MKRKRLFSAGILFVLLLTFFLTYIPHKVLKMDPAKVSSIVIFNGNTGNETEITDETSILYIVNNLSSITFQKGKPSIGYMGYSFGTSLYDQEGNKMEEFIINSSDLIRYKGFFYSAEEGSIDYEFLDKLAK
ncbi:MAG: hypothetical protein ACQEUT_11590 [Bacillota bacterium]